MSVLLIAVAVHAAKRARLLNSEDSVESVSTAQTPPQALAQRVLFDRFVQKVLRHDSSSQQLASGPVNDLLGAWHRLETEQQHSSRTVALLGQCAARFPRDRRLREAYQTALRHAMQHLSLPKERWWDGDEWAHVLPQADAVLTEMTVAVICHVILQEVDSSSETGCCSPQYICWLLRLLEVHVVTAEDRAPGPCRLVADMCSKLLSCSSPSLVQAYATLLLGHIGAC